MLEHAAMAPVTPVTVIGAGLAGCESTWQLAERGVDVVLVEQKPLARTPEQTSDAFCELVCSNSFRGADVHANAVGLLKEELRRDRHAFGPMIFEFFSAGMPTIVASTGADFALFEWSTPGLDETFEHLVSGCRGMGVRILLRHHVAGQVFVAQAVGAPLMLDFGVGEIA